jgi:PAS domain S-box-containing protein
VLLLSATMAPVPRLSIADREFHQLLAGPNPPATVVSRVYLGRAEDSMFFAVARPRRDTGQAGDEGFQGQVNVSIDPRLVSEGLGRLLVGPQDTLAAIRADGHVLARHPAFDRPLPQLPQDGVLAQALRSADRGVVMARSRMDDRTRLIAFRAVEGWPGIMVGAGRDRAAILDAWRQEALFHLLIALPAMVALAALALLVWRGQRRLAEANALLERRVAERTEALRASEARLRLATEGAGVGTWELDLRTGLGRRSPEAQAMLGSDQTIYTLEDSIALIHPDDMEEAMAARERGLDGNAPYDIVFRTVSPAADGGARWVMLRGRVERDGAGRPVHLAGVVVDITAQRRTEIALADSEARLRLATEGAGVGTFEMDLRTGLGRRSREAAQMLGTEALEFTPEDTIRLTHPQDRAAAQAERTNTTRTGRYELVFRTANPGPDGQPRWILGRGQLEHDAAGVPVRLAGVLVDITAQRRAELALAESEARLRLATEAAGVGTWEIDLRTMGGVRSARAIAMMGAEGTEYTWDGSLALVHPADRAGARAAYQQAMQTGHYEAVFRTAHPAADGGPHWLMARGRVERDQAGETLRAAGVLVDITAERRAEEARRDSEARFRAFQELSPVGFAIHRAVRDDQGQVVDFEVEYANPAAHRAVAAPAGSLPGVRLLAQVPEARTDERLFPRYCRILAGAEPGGEVDLELRNTRFNGWFRNAVVRLDAERLAVSVQDMTAEYAARETLARSHAELEALVEARTAALLRAADEKRRAEEAARQNEKLAALGQLVGGVAHDFNNLLQVIGSGAALLRRPAITDARRAAVLEGMERAGETARELTGRLLAFARQQPLVPETFSLNARIVGMSALLRQTLGGVVQVETELAPDLWQVHADPGQLELAVLNLAVNARDAMPEGGRLLLRTRNATLPATEGRQAGDYVCLDVVDAGIGMPPAVLSRALEPFFTTKEAGRGTGLGLPQVFGFARQSGGDLRLESTPGQGTTVTIKLPRAAADHGNGDATAIGSLRTPKGKAVLVVEDNVAAGEFAASLLEELGYQARTATTAVQALEMLQGGTIVDAVFSDVVLPGGMSGNELALALRRQFPQVAVVLATGYGGQAASVAPPPGVETLGKPYQLVELAAALERALARVEPVRLVQA